MKIRWTHDSVRLRITPSELEALGRSEIVKERLRFTGTVNGWGAAILPGVAATSAQLVGGDLLVRLSGKDCQQLSEPDCEGVYFQVEEDTATRYYIEKDFPCVHPRAIEAMEPQTETFPAPTGFEERKQENE